jgi:Glycosyltransferase family 87
MTSLLEPETRPQGPSASPGIPSKPRPISTQINWQRLLPAILICVPLLWRRAIFLFTPTLLGDFLPLWAGGRLFITGGNPYSGSAIFAIERYLGWPYTQPMVMLNPPWALPIVALLGVLPFETARWAWLAVSVTLEVISAIALWRYFGGEKRKQWIAVLLLATFLPASGAEQMGQITPLILAGLVAFLFTLRRRNYLLAGACLLILGLKPHLLYLVLLAVVLWAAKGRKWSFAISAIFIYASATIGPILYNHNVLGYFHGTIHAAMDTSCGVGGALRSVFGIQHGWLQFLPTVIGIGWFAVYWIRNRRGWTWEEHLPLVLLVSISTSPYFWAHDFILAIPALIALAVAISRVRTDWLIASALYLLAQVAILGAGRFSMAWMATASLLWLGLYKVGRLSLAKAEPGIPGYHKSIT